MDIRLVPCGFLKVRAVEMIKPWSLEQIGQKYPLDEEGFMRLSMNALLVVNASRVILIDPGTADFLPARLRQEYGFEMPVPLEHILHQAGFTVDEITDVLFTHRILIMEAGPLSGCPVTLSNVFPMHVIMCSGSTTSMH